MVTIQLNLPPDVERLAREMGLLSSETIAAWIEAEIERQRVLAGMHLNDALSSDLVQLREQFSTLSDAEFLQMLADDNSPVRDQQRRAAIEKARSLLTQLDALEPELSETEIKEELGTSPRLL